MGVKKSTVCTRARSSFRRYTAASSAVSKPTSRFSSNCRANFPSTLSSAAGLSFDAQPAAFTCSVSRKERRSSMVLDFTRKSLFHHGGTEYTKLSHLSFRTAGLMAVRNDNQELRSRYAVYDAVPPTPKRRFRAHEAREM